VIDVFTAAGFERQRRGTSQPRATPCVYVIISSSPEGATQPLSRPFRAWDIFDVRTQGVALGWHITPLWGLSARHLDDAGHRRACSIIWKRETRSSNFWKGS